MSPEATSPDHPVGSREGAERSDPAVRAARVEGQRDQTQQFGQPPYGQPTVRPTGNSRDSRTDSSPTDSCPTDSRASRRMGSRRTVSPRTGSPPTASRRTGSSRTVRRPYGPARSAGPAVAGRPAGTAEGQQEHADRADRGRRRGARRGRRGPVPAARQRRRCPHGERLQRTERREVERLEPRDETTLVESSVVHLVELVQLGAERREPSPGRLRPRTGSATTRTSNELRAGAASTATCRPATTLYLTSEEGSDYETYGDTCAGRQPVGAPNVSCTAPSRTN